LVEGDEVGLEVGDGVGILGADGGEGRGLEEMVAGVGSIGRGIGLLGGGMRVAKFAGHAMLPLQL
jgi:hypothetical protein